MKIDAFCHIMPRPYYDRFFTLPETEHAANLRKRVSNIPCLVDMDIRFAQMDEFGDYRQIINICAPPVESLGSPEISKEMARLGNESMAELVRSHPDRFAGFEERDFPPSICEEQCAGKADDATARDRDVFRLPHAFDCSGMRCGGAEAASALDQLGAFSVTSFAPLKVTVTCMDLRLFHSSWESG